MEKPSQGLVLPPCAVAAAGVMDCLAGEAVGSTPREFWPTCLCSVSPREGAAGYHQYK